MSSQTRGIRRSAGGWLPFRSQLLMFVMMGIALLAISPTQASAAGGSISGTVTDSAGNLLLYGCVRAYDSNGVEVEEVNAYPAGEYKMEYVDPGNYRLKFSGNCSLTTSNNVLDEFYDDKQSLAQATSVSVAADTLTPGVDAQLAPGGSISGTVTDISGDPVRNVCVKAYDSDGTQVRSARTDSSGNYTAIGLATGDHRLEFAQCGFKNNVASEFYENKETLAQATSIPVTAGSDTPDIDAQLATGGTISGTVTDSAGDPLDDIEVLAYDSSGAEVGSSVDTDAGGNYTVIGLATGDHRLEFRVSTYDGNVLGEFYDDEETLAEATPISVTAGSDLLGKDAQLAIGGSISGKIGISVGGPSGDVCRASVGVYDSDGELAGYQSLFDPWGGYTIDTLRTGDYRLYFTYACVRISSGGIVTSSGEPLAEFYFNKETLAEAAPVSVTAGSETTHINALLGRDDDSSISGTITNGTDDPLGDICVEAYDSDGDHVGSGRSDASGYYWVPGLSPGNHRIKFVDCEFNATNVNPEFYDDAETLAAATPVSVAPNSDTPGIDAQMAPGGIISGTVTDNAGRPLYGICATAYDPDGIESDRDITIDEEGSYRLAGLPTGNYRLNFSQCIFEERFTATPEFFEDAETLSQATPVSVTAGTETSGINVQMATQIIDTSPPDTGPPDTGPPADATPPVDTTVPPDSIVFKAMIGKVRVQGPAKVKKGKKATYLVNVTNSGNAAATGVGLKVEGRGVSFNSSVGKVPAGTTRTVKVKLKPKKPGKTKLTFEVTSSNAGGKSAKRGITVKK